MLFSRVIPQRHTASASRYACRNGQFEEFRADLRSERREQQRLDVHNSMERGNGRCITLCHFQQSHAAPQPHHGQKLVHRSHDVSDCTRDGHHVMCDRFSADTGRKWASTRCLSIQR